MAEGDQRVFPPQKQDKQPGIQYVMTPIPESLHPGYKPANKLHGKVALVTGGDSGIGRAVCYHFALEGATVAFTYVPGQEDRDAEDTLKKISELKASDAKDPIALPTDLKFEDKCKAVVEQVATKYGRIDILVNNAAVQYYSEIIEEIDQTQLEEVYRTNIFPHFLMTKYALMYMKEGSSIINTSSVLAFTGSPTLLDYATSKGAILNFTRGLAIQLAGKGIRVNSVAPGAGWTPLQVASPPEERATRFGSRTPIARAAQPYEISPSYVFLASQDASYFIGQVLQPDGGLMLNVVN